jgi:hypothetical protein
MKIKLVLCFGIVTALLALRAIAAEPEDPVVIFDTPFALPTLPVGDGSGIPVCIDDVGLLVEGCLLAGDGDITGVTAGSGLSGGGASGTVTLNHADTSIQGSVDNSGGTAIQDITLDTHGHITSLGSADLDNRYYTESESDNRYVDASGDSMTGDLSIIGAGKTLKVSPVGGSAVLSNVMRFTNTSVPKSGDIQNSGDLYIEFDLEVGGEIYAKKNLYMNGNVASNDDGDQTIYFYDGNSRAGQSIGWNDIEARFDVSAYTRIKGDLRVDQSVYVSEDVDVTGTVFMGYEVVVTDPEPIDDNVGNCTVLETSNCFFAFKYAYCPIGKVIIGGGCRTSNAAHALVGKSYPYSNFGWYCNSYASGDGTQYTLESYAICARMGD